MRIHHRRAVTLIEVLVAIFITALGLMALMALFPLGALSMAQAVKDSRSANGAITAIALMEAQNLRQDSYVTEALGNPSMFNGNNNGGSLRDLNGIPNYEGPSYPVYIDPVGFNSFSSIPNWPFWVGGTVNKIPRRPVQFIEALGTPLARRQARLNWFTLLDDINFGEDGYPRGSAVEREGRYSWAIMMRRPRFKDPAVVESTVVVYDRRPVQLTGNSLVPSGEFSALVANAPAAAGSKTVTLTWSSTAEPPPIKAGTWILDNTQMDPASLDPAERVAHGYFYRVVAVTPGFDATNNAPLLSLELQTPLRSPVKTVAALEGVAEVFDKGTGRQP